MRVIGRKSCTDFVFFFFWDKADIGFVEAGVDDTILK